MEDDVNWSRGRMFSTGEGRVGKDKGERFFSGSKPLITPFFFVRNRLMFFFSFRTFPQFARLGLAPTGITPSDSSHGHEAILD